MPGQVESFVRCRALGHPWSLFDPVDPIPLRDEWHYYLSLRCPECATQRFDGVDALGVVRQRRYIYPDGYRYARNCTPRRESFRLALLLTDGQGELR